MADTHTALITNDAVVLGLLAVILGFIFKTSSSENPKLKAFYKYVPALLLCYFLPSLLNTFGIVDGHSSNVYYVASRYLLPACLILLTISIDLKAIINLGPKALIMFLVGTLGIVIGGPLSILVVSVFSPDLVGGHGPDAVWRGMTTVAGSWIGGGANQASMKEMFEVGGDIFSVMVTVDVIVANIWMAVLLLMAANHKKIDAATGADTTAIEDLKNRVEQYHAEHARMPTLNDYMTIIAIAFGITGLAHFCADFLGPFFANNYAWAKEYSLNSKFFWLIVISTTIGISLSFTKVRQIEAFGASKVASSFLYILVASIGLHMNVTAIFSNPGLFLIGAIWMLTHASLMLIVAKLIKAPLFYMAVGSQANVGGAASAPVVASAFHPSLAPVGVLLAVLGYGVGTYMAYICGLMMQAVAP
ncbi:hypothetical protein A2I98_08450 [Pseudoalteromonas agarivorans]|jgi:uncharacterized membrane protein|uniref:DUF819 domain-containing protein n=2 Tax=Pseudoalteromonas TaxID=53246 RepID=A0ABR5VVB2_9GAMM|nr:MULTISPECIES: DUF819 family protein [Pseudoalteromonas]MAJ39968.1 DUF819 domain-containing protein [Pseudoalteromonadaceae bacterium]OUX89174.1 MAG: hypothetical protein CBC03_07875 [Pseudoalteromonas sp. TMED43]KYL34997.1 hypothetical protein A2I98_08450 [Pseudoalteromonas telluritireducens]MCK8118611.1 DUF819 family protein [Pseudoalteromonas sp. 2CM37A]MCW1718932.1 DUF819 family protein [Pseudoalteromonas sp. A3]|tara:strand:+ start:1024 stop:2277 length:1254 start_codon:yes stop_codon:yes gene_type:complete